MKLFTITKYAYSAGVYGNSGEYYNLIIFNGKELIGTSFYGQYGADERVKEALKDKGYIEQYTGSVVFGKVKEREAKKYSHSEYYLTENMQEFLDKGHLSYDN